MSNRESLGLKLFLVMFKYECFVRFLVYVFMVVWYYYGIVMNVCWIMWDLTGDINGFEFCNCYVVVRRGRKLKYFFVLIYLLSVFSVLCDFCLFEVWGGVVGEGCVLSIY